mmetsp:Transcript_124553/g.219254  ORF Transcript_124553/g.219254 Transcript_124553/m.219254 type:complete len:87 (-) Transcript_124553:125-385(-)
MCQFCGEASVRRLCSGFADALLLVFLLLFFFARNMAIIICSPGGPEHQGQNAQRYASHTDSKSKRQLQIKLFLCRVHWSVKVVALE